MQDMVEEFENKCVNFMEKTEDDSSENEEYNPEANVNIVNVDNNYHAVSMTEQDNQAYDDEHKSFSEEIFDKLVTSIGGRRVGNEVTVSDEESGRLPDAFYSLLTLKSLYPYQQMFHMISVQCMRRSLMQTIRSLEVLMTQTMNCLL